MPRRQDLTSALEDSGADAPANACVHVDLGSSPELFRVLFDLSPDAVFFFVRGIVTHANPAAVRLLGAERLDQLIGRRSTEIVHADSIPVVEQRAAALFGGAPSIPAAEEKYVALDGTILDVETNVALVPTREGKAFVVIARDIRERKLAQAKKMEGIGRLAGGIAHDFNNLLTVVLGGAQELERRLGADDEISRIRKAAERATAMTRQLLSFARQSPVEPRVVSINELVSGAARLLGRVLGEDLTLVTSLDEDVKCVFIDPGQMDQVLMNLAVNSRDAMPSGGTLTMATRNVDADGGAWIEIAVSDTGVGMSEATRARVFEPFFTTKEIGKGTGLGLSTCHGLVQQLGGRITVESELGAGTTLRILLPACAPSPSVVPPRPAPVTAVSGGETVLLIEDDRMVRTLTMRLLKLLGYQVLVAALPGEGLTIAREHPAKIDLLMTDVMMPESSGPEAARAIRAIRPEIRVLYVSGYSADALPAEDHDLHFLGKPFTREELAAKLRQVLATPLPPPP